MDEGQRVSGSINPEGGAEEATHRCQGHQYSLEHEGCVRADVLFKAPSIFYREIGNGCIRTETCSMLSSSGLLCPPPASLLTGAVQTKVLPSEVFKI